MLGAYIPPVDSTGNATTITGEGDARIIIACVPSQVSVLVRAGPLLLNVECARDEGTRDHEITSHETPR